MEDENRFLNSLDIFVYPTLGEGLGLGPLEAMACGVPVLASNTTSMPEVVGDGGILTKPNAEDFHNELTKLIDDAKLRKRLAARGLKRASNLTWKRTAEDSLEVYETIE
jgi:glycosyltransferase involved in cell wall biosynthesis